MYQTGQFFFDLLRLRMAAVEEQCCAPGVFGRSGNTGQQHWTTVDRFSPYHWVNQLDKQRPPVIHNCHHSGGDLRALEILIVVNPPQPHWFFSSSNVFSASPDPDRVVQVDYATSCLDFFNHEVVIAATDLRCGTRCPLDDGDPLTNEVRSLGVGWLDCTVRVGYPDADRSASGTV